MTVVGRRAVVLMVALSLALAAAVLPGQADAVGAQAAAAQQERHLPTRLRVRNLLRQMTLREKVGQMTQISVQALMESPGYPYGSGPLDPDLLELVLGDNQVGSLLSGVALLARTQGDVSGDGPREVVPGEYTLSVGGATTTVTVQ